MNLIASLGILVAAQSGHPLYGSASSTNAGISGNALVTGDFNEDGRPDVAVAVQLANQVVVFFGQAGGAFSAGSSVSTAVANAYGLAAGDVNGDGHLDLAVPNYGNTSVTILLGAGNGSFAAQAPTATTTANPGDAALADLDGDADLDLATLDPVANSVNVFLGAGNGTFAFSTALAVGAAGGSLVIGQFTGAAAPDIAVSKAGGAIRIFEGNGAGGFPSSTDKATGSASMPYDIAAADLDGDGALDLVAPNFTANTVSVLRATDGFTTPAAYASGGQAPFVLLARDLNGDAKADIAVGNSTSGDVAVLLGNGDGTLAAAYPYALAGSPEGIDAANLNGVGATDLAMTVPGVNGFQVLLSGAPTIGLSPSTFTFSGVAGGADPASQTLAVQNTAGASTTLNFTATDDAAWLALAPAAGAVAGGSSTNVTLSVSLAGLAAGTYNATVTVADAAATNSPQTAAVTLVVTSSAVPVIGLSATTLAFTGSGTQSLTVANSGAAGTTLSYAVTDDAAWLSVSPASGGLAAGASATHTVTVDATGLAAGTYNGTITITDAGAANSPRTVAVTLTVSPAATLGVSPATLMFEWLSGANPSSQTITVTNTGADGSSLGYDVTADATWVGITPSAGTLTSGASGSHTIQVDPASLGAGKHTATITVRDTTGQAASQTVALTLWNLPAMPFFDVESAMREEIAPGRAATYSIRIRNKGTGRGVAGIIVSFPGDYDVASWNLGAPADILFQGARLAVFAVTLGTGEGEYFPLDVSVKVPPSLVDYPGSMADDGNPLKIGERTGVPRAMLFASLSEAEWSTVLATDDVPRYGMKRTAEVTDDLVDRITAMADQDQYDYLMRLGQVNGEYADALAEFRIQEIALRMVEDGMTTLTKPERSATPGPEGLDYPYDRLDARGIEEANAVDVEWWMVPIQGMVNTFEGFKDGRNADALSGLASGAVENISFGLLKDTVPPAYGNDFEYRIGRTTGHIAMTAETLVAGAYLQAGNARLIYSAGKVPGEPIHIGIDMIAQGRGGLLFKAGEQTNLIHFGVGKFGPHLGLYGARTRPITLPTGQTVYGTWAHFYPAKAYIFGVGDIGYLQLARYVGALYLLYREGARTGYSRGPKLVASIDPNELAADPPAGYLRGAVPIRYRIDFENLAAATAAAQDVRVEFPVDADLDLSTLRFGESSHPGVLSTAVDAAARTITWTFTGINLSPNATPPEGEGWVELTITPSAGLADGAEIRSRASIVFDFNPAIATSEVVHTIDTQAPVTTLTATADASGAVAVTWSGTDAVSGVRAALLSVSTDGAGYVPWTVATERSATYAGSPGHTYAFMALGEDNAGNLEEVKGAADAELAIAGSAAASSGGGGGSMCQADHGVGAVALWLILALVAAAAYARRGSLALVIRSTSERAESMPRAICDALRTPS